MTIGSRSQSARTYLERHLSTFNACSKDDIICHGIHAIRSTLPNDELVSKDDGGSQLNITVAIVGKDQPFKILSDEENLKYLEMAKQRGAAIIVSKSDDDDDKPSTEDSQEPPSRDPQVAVATMENP